MGLDFSLWLYIMYLPFERRRTDLYQNAVLENSTHYFIPSQVYLALPVLSPVFPLTLVKRPISPKHFSVTLSFIVDEVAFVKVPARKVKLTITLFEFLNVISDVLSFLLGPFPFPVSESIFKSAFIYC